MAHKSEHNIAAIRASGRPERHAILFWRRERRLASIVRIEQVQGIPSEEHQSVRRPGKAAHASPGSDLLRLAAARVRCRRYEQIEVTLPQNRGQHVPVSGKAQGAVVTDVVGHGSNFTISIRDFHNLVAAESRLRAQI